jgi:hypothetical protein
VRGTHSPGPWQWDEPANWHKLDARVCADTYEPIAQVKLSGWPRKTGLANARLIAAAPDLLHALKECTEFPGFDMLPQEVRALVKAAIIKAEGK